MNAAKILAKDILQNPSRHEWTLQGMGMLRTYLPDGSRLQVWDVRHAFPGVSLIHDHPWHFNSMILAGVLRNERFNEFEEPVVTTADRTVLHMMRRTIRPGIGLKVIDDDVPVFLVSRGVEEYREGAFYYQRAAEIHLSRPEPGTVTLIQRERVGDDVARTYYPVGGQWGTAEPRAATLEEIGQITSFALERWF